MEATATAAAEPELEWQPHFELWFLILLDRLCESERSWTEGYPLASLKQDFRHETGLEIDHRSLGFNNLSGFISRCYSHLCTLENVGSGRNQRLIVRPTRTPIRHNTEVANIYATFLLFAIAVALHLFFTIDNDNKKV